MGCNLSHMQWAVEHPFMYTFSIPEILLVMSAEQLGKHLVIHPILHILKLVQLSFGSRQTIFTSGHTPGHWMS